MRLFQGTAEQLFVEVHLTAERFSFAPSRIRVKTGTIVEIVAASEDTTHGFHLPDAGIDERIPARGKGELRLRFCSLGSGDLFLRVLTALRSGPQHDARNDSGRGLNQWRGIGTRGEQRLQESCWRGFSGSMGASGQNRQSLETRFGSPLPGITPQEFERFRVGREDFLEVEEAEEGLGPTFNGRSCGECHNIPAVGGSGTILEFRAGRRDADGNFDPLPGGSLFQLFSIPPHNCQEQIPAEANVVGPRKIHSAVRGRAGGRHSGPNADRAGRPQ